jgi:hypothetical protein
MSRGARFHDVNWLRSTTVVRRIERHLSRAPLVVLEHRAWHGYAIQLVQPHAMRIRVRYGEPAERVLAGVPHAARAVLMHADASRTDGFIARAPDLWAALQARGTIALNAQATDIRKRTLRMRCDALGLPSAAAAREGAPDERVIIKTNLNSGGAPERQLGRVLGGLANPFAEELNDTVRDASDYRVCRRDEVPTGAWSDSTLVIERFIENPEGVFFRVHMVGSATSVAEIWSELEVKKVTLGVRRRVNHFYWRTSDGDLAQGPSTDTVARVVALVRRVHADMGIGFGATDCVMDANGTLVVVDANKTPGAADIASQPDVVAHLCRGFDDLLSKP